MNRKEVDILRIESWVKEFKVSCKEAEKR